MALFFGVVASAATFSFLFSLQIFLFCIDTLFKSRRRMERVKVGDIKYYFEMWVLRTPDVSMYAMPWQIHTIPASFVQRKREEKLSLKQTKSSIKCPRITKTSILLPNTLHFYIDFAFQKPEKWSYRSTLKGYWDKAKLNKVKTRTSTTKEQIYELNWTIQ